MSKKIVEVEFEDHGQDFQVWKIEMDGTMGKVVESDMQNSIWTEFYVLNEPKKGVRLKISKGPTDDVITIKYPLIKVKTLKADAVK